MENNKFSALLVSALFSCLSLGGCMANAMPEIPRETFQADCVDIRSIEACGFITTLDPYVAYCETLNRVATESGCYREVSEAIQCQRDSWEIEAHVLNRICGVRHEGIPADPHGLYEQYCHEEGEAYRLCRGVESNILW